MSGVINGLRVCTPVALAQGKGSGSTLCMSLGVRTQPVH